MNEDQLTLLTLDLRPVPDLLRSGGFFDHVQRSPPTFPTMPLRWRSLPINLRSLPFNSRLFPIGPDFQIGLDREQIVAQWNGGITRVIKISSLNFLYIGIMRLWLQLYKYIFMTSLMTSQDHKVGQILKLIYLLQYLNSSFDQKLKMSEMLMAILSVYSTFGITFGEKVCRELKMAAILNILKY